MDRMKQEGKRQDMKQRNRRKEDWNIRPYLAIGLMIFILFCACLAVAAVIFQFRSIQIFFGKLLSILQPIVFGAFIGYLINPLMKLFERGLYKLKSPKGNSWRFERMVRPVSSILAVVVFVCLVVLLVSVMLPQIMESIVRMAETFPEQADSLITRMGEWQFGNLKLSEHIESLLKEGVDFLQNWTETLLPKIQTYILSITSGVISVLNLLKNLIIGLIVAIYVLCEKEKFEGQAKKIVTAVCPPKMASEIIQIFHTGNEILGGFIKGKLLDSLIIGIICYVVLAILRMPYSGLVSVIVGATNIIPFFGPFIGAIPSALLILVDSPVKALYFIIFIIILQQVDGNIIGPKILGDSTGLSSFWVMFAILLGSGMFGIPGMLFGCPVFGVIYYLIEKMISHFLRKKSLPLETGQYIGMTGVDAEPIGLRYDLYEDDVIKEKMCEKQTEIKKDGDIQENKKENQKADS